MCSVPLSQSFSPEPRTDAVGISEGAGRAASGVLWCPLSVVVGVGRGAATYGTRQPAVGLDLAFRGVPRRLPDPHTAENARGTQAWVSAVAPWCRQASRLCGWWVFQKRIAD